MRVINNMGAEEILLRSQFYETILVSMKNLIIIIMETLKICYQVSFI